MSKGHDRSLKPNHAQANRKLGAALIEGGIRFGEAIRLTDDGGTGGANAESRRSRCGGLPIAGWEADKRLFKCTLAAKGINIDRPTNPNLAGTVYLLRNGLHLLLRYPKSREEIDAGYNDPAAIG